ncbi:MAG: tyrosine-type recombinase/integrase [Candidatus Methanoperedens sp.]|nr:tyrosine-type recombinase/integrase [Candidatus Methanoperedens sp.]
MKCNASDRFIPLSSKQIRNIVKGLYKRAGINKKCNPHMLRHSQITYMASLNSSETELSYRFWGVAHSAMVAVYIHLSTQQQADSYLNIKGLGEKNVTINPLASRCVECGDQIISGSLCPKCDKIKLLSENDKTNIFKMSNLAEENEMMKEKIQTLENVVNTQIEQMKSIFANIATFEIGKEIMKVKEEK